MQRFGRQLVPGHVNSRTPAVTDDLNPFLLKPAQPLLALPLDAAVVGDEDHRPGSARRRRDQEPPVGTEFLEKAGTERFHDVPSPSL